MCKAQIIVQWYRVTIQLVTNRVRLALDRNCWVCRKCLLHSTVTGFASSPFLFRACFEAATVECSNHFLHTQQFLSRTKRTLVMNLPLTPKQKFCFGLARLCQARPGQARPGQARLNGTFVLKSSGGSSQAEWSPCSVEKFNKYLIPPLELVQRSVIYKICNVTMSLCSDGRGQVQQKSSDLLIKTF